MSIDALSLIQKVALSIHEDPVKVLNDPVFKKNLKKYIHEKEVQIKVKGMVENRGLTFM
ncbi:hypothetical protein [Schinkia azotoformans]|uniref:hypothetical protein n=1 Tax=Schinkia azotoformans TaxID=1454 RepID=UPI002DBABE1D|nr:hypothetical protein [Schinkia azotoformans]MEC1759871.1 hypothetical protein [Schinkia azotoformans]